MDWRVSDPTAPGRHASFHRRLAPVAMLVGVGVLVWQMCKPPDRVDVTLTVDLGAAAERVTDVEVRIRDGETVVGQVRRRQGGPHAISPLVTKLSLPRGLLTVEFDVVAGSRRHQLSRRIDVQSGTPQVEVSVGDELAR